MVEQTSSEAPPANHSDAPVASKKLRPMPRKVAKNLGDSRGVESKNENHSPDITNKGMFSKKTRLAPDDKPPEVEEGIHLHALQDLSNLGANASRAVNVTNTKIAVHHRVTCIW